MFPVPETADMHELDDKAVSSGQPGEDKDLAKGSTQRAVEASAAPKAQEAAGHFSPDPLKRTDRYRLSQPYELHL